MRFGRCALALIVTCVACGDNVTRRYGTPFDAVSGTRLRVERYMFDDGTTLPAATGFFDAELHVRCTPQSWIDGTVRCVPDAEEALFSDAACATAIGRGMAIMDPSYFVGHETVRQPAGPLVALPAHVYRAGQPIAAPGQYYQRSEGTCIGPFFTPSDYVYYQLTGEVDVVEIRENMIGEGRLALRVRTSTDGAITPLALFDRDLAVDCEPSARSDAAAVCEPVNVNTASLYADPTCEQHAVALVGSPTLQPLVARLEHGGDCATYHTLGPELTTPVYRLQGDACVTASRITGVQYRPLLEEASLAAVERTVEASPHRLHRIIAASEDLVTYSARLFDNAIRGECARYPIGEIERCLPTNTIAATPLFAAGCVQQLRITQAPTRSCNPPAFAVWLGDEVEVSALGDITNQVVYSFANDGTCKPYIPPPDQVLRVLGPALPADTFIAARAYGER